MRLEEVGRDAQPGRIELCHFYLPPRVFWEIIKAGQKANGRIENPNAIHPGSGISWLLIQGLLVSQMLDYLEENKPALKGTHLMDIFHLCCKCQHTEHPEVGRVSLASTHSHLSIFSRLSRKLCSGVSVLGGGFDTFAWL